MEIEGLRKIDHKICKKDKNTHGLSYKGYRRKHQSETNQECIQGYLINKGRVPTTNETLLSHKS